VPEICAVPKKGLGWANPYFVTPNGKTLIFHVIPCLAQIPFAAGMGIFRAQLPMFGNRESHNVGREKWTQKSCSEVAVVAEEKLRLW
jgi:hypothetical protein